MQTLWTGIAAYINTWRAPFAIVVVIIAAYMWMRGHHAAAALELLGALALFYTAAQLAPQLGF